MKVLITGGSHTASLAAGLELLREAGQVPAGVDITFAPLGGALAEVGKFFEVRGDQIVITHDKYRRRLPRLSASETPFDAVGFSTPFHSRGVWMLPDWHGWGLPSLESSRIPVSRALVRRCVRDHNAHLIAFLVALKQVGFKAFAIEGPKPFRHNREVDIAGWQTVAHIDREYSLHTREALQGHDIPSLLMPTETCDADGFSLPEFRHDDPKDVHHGNAAIGAVMMAQVLTFLQRPGAVKESLQS